LDYMDLLARLGISSAHPGGFRATRKLLEKGRLTAGLHILEVGCGTGKTACYLARQGCQVTALDQHPLMLEKARKRAEQEGAKGIRFVEGSVLALPFEDASFDMVFAESVTIFADLSMALREYHRVLKPEGRLLDRELVLDQPMPEEIGREIKSFFRLQKIYTVDEWLKELYRAGFECERPDPEAFGSIEPDLPEESGMRELDLTALFDPEIGSSLLKYSDLMVKQQTYFKACDFVAVKTPVHVPPA